MELKTLERMTVIKLREEALKIPELSGVRAMSKEQLIRALAAAHGIDLAQRQRGGGDKAELKKQISGLKTQIAEAIRSQQKSDLKRLRRQVKQLKAQTRRLAKAKPIAPVASEAPAAS